MTNPLQKALHKKSVETEREREVRTNNERSRISNMTPIWRDRHNRRHGKKSEYDHSLESRKKVIAMYSKD